MASEGKNLGRTAQDRDGFEGKTRECKMCSREILVVPIQGRPGQIMALDVQPTTFRVIRTDLGDGEGLRLVAIQADFVYVTHAMLCAGVLKEL